MKCGIVTGDSVITEMREILNRSGCWRWSKTLSTKCKTLFWGITKGKRVFCVCAVSGEIEIARGSKASRDSRWFNKRI